MKSFYYIAIIIFLFSITSCATRTRVVTRPAPKTVTVVKVAPRGHKVIYVKGKRYYKWNGKHYRKTRRGYVFVRI